MKPIILSFQSEEFNEYLRKKFEYEYGYIIDVISITKENCIEKIENVIGAKNIYIIIGLFENSDHCLLFKDYQIDGIITINPTENFKNNIINFKVNVRCGIRLLFSKGKDKNVKKNNYIMTLTFPTKCPFFSEWRKDDIIIQIMNQVRAIICLK